MEKESLEICLWLDQLFPDKSRVLFPEPQRELVLKTERWVDNTLFSAAFRSLVDNERFFSSAQIGYELGTILCETSGMNMPFASTVFPYMYWLIIRLSGAGGSNFVYTNAALSFERHASLQSLREDIRADIEGIIGDGPFAHALQQPTLNDLTIYAFLYLVELPRYSYLFEGSLLQSSAVKEWVERLENVFTKDSGDTYHPPPIVPERLLPPKVGAHLQSRL